MNVFNEKIFTIIWFWLVFLTLNNFKSLLTVLIQTHLSRMKYRYVANYLNLFSKKERFKRHLLVKRFIYDYLTTDSILILRLVSENISDLLTSQVINDLWNEYKKLCNLSAAKREKYQRSKDLGQGKSESSPSLSNRNVRYQHSFL